MQNGFDSILGRENIKESLINAILSDKVSHAYIFNGESGTGKEFVGRLFAMAIQCEEKNGTPCMECSSCRMALSGNHPDIIVVGHEKPASVGVDDIRKSIIEDIEIKPYCSKKKIYIVPDASKMTVQAQNALLKTIEEPPAYAHIILLADNLDALLPTVLSRCVTVNFKPLGDELVKNYLINQLGIDPKEANACAAFAQGNVGRAIKLTGSGDFVEKLSESIRYLKRSKEISSLELMEFNKEISGDKQGLNDYFDIFTIWFRDVLYYKASNDPDKLVFKDQHDAIKQRAKLSSYEGLMKIIDSIKEAKVRIKANVNPELVLELLLYCIKEN